MSLIGTGNYDFLGMFVQFVFIFGKKNRVIADVEIIIFKNRPWLLLISFTLQNRYGREYADPYLGHGIGPVPGYGVSWVIVFGFSKWLKWCGLWFFPYFFNQF